MTRNVVRILVLALVCSLAPGCANQSDPADSGVEPVVSETLAARRPVFAGACKACPWGVLARVTADALSFYGYDTTICWVCWSTYGPRQMGDKLVPVMPDSIGDPEYVEPPPDDVPDISATSESNLISAWNGVGPYAGEGPRHNYRVVAVVRNATYTLAAASRSSGITDLRQVKDRTEPTWIAGRPSSIILDYYGISIEDLEAKGGGILPPAGNGPGRISREEQASADLFIGNGLLANTPEQRSWYEATQLNDLVFLDFEDALIEQLAQEPGYHRGTVPLALFRGVDRPIPTVIRPNHLIYVRDDTPDAFAYDVAKALDEHRDLFQVQMMAWFYDTNVVARSAVIPMHPGAMRYYREQGYVE